MRITVLDGEHSTLVDSIDGTTISVDDLARSTGWQLKPEGLCRGDVCVPVRDRGALLDGDAVRIEAFGSALHRPVVVDPANMIVAVGESAAAVAEQLRQRRAPDFTLPDIQGTPHTMSAIGRKKKVLVVWASW